MSLNRLGGVGGLGARFPIVLVLYQELECRRSGRGRLRSEDSCELYLFFDLNHKVRSGDKVEALHRFVYAMCRYPQGVALPTNGQAHYFVLVSRHVRKKDDMSIKVLLADDSHVTLAAIRKRLAEDSRIRLVGAVSSFAAMMQMISDFKPEVLLLDLHLPEERHFTPDFIKSQLGSVPHTLAVSLSNDAEAKALAFSYGAESLLDKMKLYDQMIPAIMSCCKAHEIRYPGRKHPNRC